MGSSWLPKHARAGSNRLWQLIRAIATRNGLAALSTSLISRETLTSRNPMVACKVIALSSSQLEVLESDAGDFFCITVNAGDCVGFWKGLSSSLSLVTASVKLPRSSILHYCRRL